MLEAAKQNLPVPFREDGPALAFEFDDTPLIDDNGVYLDEQAPTKRKRVDGDEEEAPRKRRQSAGAKGSARSVEHLRLQIMMRAVWNLTRQAQIWLKRLTQEVWGVRAARG